jgi:hypothetical protein
LSAIYVTTIQTSTAVGSTALHLTQERQNGRQSSSHTSSEGVSGLIFPRIQKKAAQNQSYRTVAEAERKKGRCREELGANDLNRREGSAKLAGNEALEDWESGKNALV